MHIFGISDIGNVRKVNQDNYYTKMLSKNMALGVVCDGMGGTNGGCEASTIAMYEFSSFMNEALEAISSPEGNLEISEARMRRVMVQGVNKANNAVYEKSSTLPELEGMGTTLVCCLATEEKLYCINVGDSRMYVVANGSLSQITKDHSYVQYLVDEGMIQPDEAEKHPRKNIITRAVGTHNEVEPDFFVVENDNTVEYVLLCSDGLTNYITEKEILKIITETPSQQQACQMLVDKANANGGGDNITVVLLSM